MSLLILADKRHYNYYRSQHLEFWFSEIGFERYSTNFLTSFKACRLTLAATKISLQCIILTKPMRLTDVTCAFLKYTGKELVETMWYSQRYTLD